MNLNLRRLLLVALLAAGLLLAGLAIMAAGQWAGNAALAELSRQAQGTAQLNTLALRTYLEKFRAIPRVLADDPEVRQALQRPQTQAPADVLNRKLERLNRDIGASVIYLLRTDGLAIAASNWQEPISFVGQSYRFRPYFQQAMDSGQAEYFALGTVSQEPGLYLSRRIDDANGDTLGVIVLKMIFGPLEQDWSRMAQPVYVTDTHGVVLISNVPGWRFRTLAPLPDDMSRALRASLQFGDAALQPLPLAASTP
ncbi:cache domain-containing protein, partial [Bordetella petrii]|uniref:cache domain-containing protein n=1 Tax=Bordetella petrii TaxID=94624 RepID=UPI0022A6AD90